MTHVSENSCHNQIMATMKSVGCIRESCRMHSVNIGPGQGNSLCYIWEQELGCGDCIRVAL
eukprot:5335024-Prymnesium_polylepis.1